MCDFLNIIEISATNITLLGNISCTKQKVLNKFKVAQRKIL